MATLQEEIASVRYKEAVYKPRLEKSLENLVEKYTDLMTGYHVASLPELLRLIEDAYNEGDEVIVQKEFNGYFVSIFKS